MFDESKIDPSERRLRQFIRAHDWSVLFSYGAIVAIVLGIATLLSLAAQDERARGNKQYYQCIKDGEKTYICEGLFGKYK